MPSQPECGSILMNAVVFSSFTCKCQHAVKIKKMMAGMWTSLIIHPLTISRQGACLRFTVFLKTSCDVWNRCAQYTVISYNASSFKCSFFKGLHQKTVLISVFIQKQHKSYFTCCNRCIINCTEPGQAVILSPVEFRWQLILMGYTILQSLFNPYRQHAPGGTGS